MWEFLSRLDFYAKLGLFSGLLFTGGAVILIAYQLFNFKKLSEIRGIWTIASLSLLQSWTSNLHPLFENELILYAIDVSAPIYIVIESIVLQYTFYKIINSRKVRSVLKISILLSVLLLATETTNDFKYINEKYLELTLLTSILMLFLCFVSYYQIIDYASDKALTKSYKFWFVTAVFFFFSISLPLFFLRESLYNQNINDERRYLLVTFGYVYYFIFFLLLYFSSRCKVRAQK